LLSLPPKRLTSYCIFLFFVNPGGDNVTTNTDHYFPKMAPPAKTKENRKISRTVLIDFAGSSYLKYNKEAKKEGQEFLILKQLNSFFIRFGLHYGRSGYY
jgi:hypothetical protein